MPITLWRPTGQAELDLVAGSGWDDALSVADSVEAFVSSIEDGTLAYN